MYQFKFFPNTMTRDGKYLNVYVNVSPLWNYDIRINIMMFQNLDFDALIVKSLLKSSES